MTSTMEVDPDVQEMEVQENSQGNRTFCEETIDCTKL